MRSVPPHILLTNYSMLEYLMIRPDDSPLFDGGRGVHWRFIVLDEAHQYRGAKGMEMGMLIRRLKQRLAAGGRAEPFQCIATSATLSSGEGEDDKRAVAQFARELFGEPFPPAGVIFGSSQVREQRTPRRYHTFLRALEGAFLVHHDGQDAVVLNRKAALPDGTEAEPLEIALCRECGQHYYVGRERHGRLEEAVRDPSQSGFGVEYYRPLESGTGATHVLCRPLWRYVLRSAYRAKVQLWHSGYDPRCEVRVPQCPSRPTQEMRKLRLSAWRRGRSGAGDRPRFGRPQRGHCHGST